MGADGAHRRSLALTQRSNVATGGLLPALPYSVKEAADVLGLPASRVEALLRTPKLDGYRYSDGRIRIPPESLSAYAQTLRGR